MPPLARAFVKTPQRLGLLKRLSGRCSLHSFISSGTRYQPANKPPNPASKVHKKAYRGVPKAALTLVFVQPKILSDLRIPPVLICTRLASRIREDPGRSLHKPSTRDVSLWFILTSKGMNRYRLQTSRCFR